MSKFLLSILILSSANAFASKARVNSLQGANHLVDTQTVFTVPSHLLLLNPYATFEFGSATGTPNAEGGLMRNFGAGKLLAYVGHQNTTGFDGIADVRTAKPYSTQHNPIEVLYAKGNMGFGASFSWFEDKNGGESEKSLVAKWSMNVPNDGWIYAHLQAFAQAENASDVMASWPWLKVGGAKAQGNLRFFGELNAGKAKEEPAAGGDNDITNIGVHVGVEDRSLKTDKVDIYYGAKLSYAQQDKDAADKKVYKLPAFLGLEYPVTSWATARASVQQNILIGKTEDKTLTPDETSVPKDTTVAAGLGLKYNNLTFDGVLTAAQDGAVNGTTFISNASLTYNF